jgi:hypothetical protein
MSWRRVATQDFGIDFCYSRPAEVAPQDPVVVLGGGRDLTGARSPLCGKVHAAQPAGRFPALRSGI